MIVLLDNVLHAYDDPVLLFFHYMMYVSQQVETFCLLSTRDTTIPEYLTSLSVSGDYLTGKFGPRDFRCIVWKGKRFGPAFGANNEKLHDYGNRESIPDDDRNILAQNSVEKKFDVVNNTRPNNVFGFPSFAAKTASVTPSSSTTSAGIFERNIIPVLNASVGDKERFLEIWDILVEVKSHFKLPHEIGVDPVRRLIRILKSAIKHFPKMDTQVHIKHPYWVCNYFLLTEEQAKNVKHLLDRMSTERVMPPLVAIATLIAEFQQGILELKSSRFLKDSIPVSEFARYCVLVRHSIFSAKVGSRKDLLLFWDEVWKEWLSSSDEERSKRMLGCAGVHRSWADDDEMRLFVASSEDSEEEGDVDDSFARSGTGGSQDVGLELIKESESEETFVDGIDMSTSESKIGKFGYVDEPILSDSPLIGSTESLSKDLFENAATAVMREIYTPPIIENTVDDLFNGFGQATADKIEETSKTSVVEIYSIHSDEMKHEGTEQITTEESADIDDKIESGTSTVINIPNDERLVAESAPIPEKDFVEDHGTEPTNDATSPTEPKTDIEEAAKSPFPDESKKDKDTIETGDIVESVVEDEVRSEEQDYIGSLSTDNSYVVSEINLTMDTPQNYDDNFDEVNETTELGENIDETIQHSASKNSLDEHFTFNSSDTHSHVSTDSNEELQTMYNDSDDIYPDEPSPYDDSNIDTDKFRQPGALTAVLDVSSTSSSACHSENEYEEVVSPVKSVESRDESIPEKIEMFEKLGGHKPMQRHLHHTLSNEEITFAKADGKNVKSILKPVTNRPDNGIVVQLKEFIENKPQLISLKSTEDFITLETERKPAMSIKKGRSISEIFAALLDDNMKDLSISAEYKNKIVRPQDLYNRIKIETDKPWEKLSRRTKERYYGAFLRKYDDALNRPENCTVDIVDIFEIVKVCVDFDDVKHKIVRYAINIVENKEAFVPKQNSDDDESDSDSLGIRNGNERRSYDGITNHGLSSARSMNRTSSGKSLNSLRGLRLSRDSSSSSILLPQDRIPEVNEVTVKASYGDGNTIREEDVIS